MEHGQRGLTGPRMKAPTRRHKKYDRREEYTRNISRLVEILNGVERRLRGLHSDTGVFAELQDLEAIMARINTLSLEARRWLFARIKTYWPSYFEEAGLLPSDSLPPLPPRKLPSRRPPPRTPPPPSDPPPPPDLPSPSIRYKFPADV